MLKVEIPESKDKIEKQILALEYQLTQDRNEKDIEIHREALHDLRMALNKVNE